MTQRDDEFLGRDEQFAEPHGDGLNYGSSGYAEGLRSTRAERRASRDNERREAMRKAFVASAGVMGAVVVVAAVFVVLVFAGVFPVSPGVGGGNRTDTLVQQPASAPDPSAPNTTTVPLSPVDNAGAVLPSTAEQTGRPPPPSSNRAAILPSTAGTQVPAVPQMNSIGSQQLSSATSPPPSSAPVPAPPQATASAESPTCPGNSKKCHAAGRASVEVSSEPRRPR